MKKRTAVTLLCLAIAFATAATADDQEFQGWMKDTQKTVGKLRKEIEAKAFTDVATDAATLQEIFKNVEGYFAKAHTDDAVAMSQAVQTIAKQLADAATSGNAEGAAASLKGVMANCAGCHAAHREKLPDGTSKIK